MSKKLLFIAQFFRPETNAGANRTTAFLEDLSRSFDVHLVTLRPSYPSPAHFAGCRVDDSRWPFEVARTGELDPHEGSLVSRAVREQKMALRLGWSARSWRADVVVATSPSMFLGPVALVLARVKGARFVWDLRDLTWRYALELSGGRVGRIAGKALTVLMEWTARRADLVVSTTESTARALRERGVRVERLLTVPNGVDTPFVRDYDAVPAPPSAGTGATVTYAGVIGFNQSLRPLIDAAAALKERGVTVVLAGDGPEKEILEKHAAERGADNVTFAGYLDRLSLMRLYKSSDVLVSHLQDTPSLVSAFPSKLSEYLVTGKPVVFAGRGEGAAFVTEAGAGLVVPPNDPAALSGAIGKLLDDPEMCREMGERGRAYVQENRMREVLARRFTERVTDVAGR